MAELIRFTTDIEIEAASAGESTGPRKFTTKAYTGGPLSVARYDLPIVIDLAGMTPAKSVVANLNHDKARVIGHVPDVTNTGKSLTLGGVVSVPGADADKFTQAHDNGFPWQASVEAQPSQVDEIAEGNTVKVNGQSHDGPIYVARKSTLYGVAFLPRGADENTSVSIAASAAEKLLKGKNMKYAEWIEAMGLDETTLTDKQKGLLQAKYDAEIAAAKKTAPNVEPIIAQPVYNRDAIRDAGDEFTDSLELVFAEYEAEAIDKKKFLEVVAGARKEARKLKQTALGEKWAAPRLMVEAAKSLGKTEVALSRLGIPESPQTRSGSGRDESPLIIEAALCMQRNMPGIEKQYDEKTLDAARKNYRNIGLQQVLIMAAAANGYRFGTGERIHAGNIEKILAYALPIDRRGDIHAEGASTMGVSLSNMLSNVANKELLIGYMQDDNAWSEIAVVKSVNDLKAVTSYRMTDNMEYEEVGPNGEIKHGQVGQESYTRQAKTYAKMFAITRTDIINDDLGAFDDVRRRLGVGSGLKFNRLFWTKFLASISTLFTAGNGNYISGGTSVLDLAGIGLEAALLKFLTMTSSSADDAKRIGGRPSILLCPPELSFVADRLHVSQNLVGVGGGTNAIEPSANIHANKYRPVMAPCLSDATFASHTSTGWGLFRAKEQYAAMVVSFLNGQQSPTVQSSEADFDTLGVQFRGYHDFGVDTADHVAGVWSAGV